MDDVSPTEYLIAAECGWKRYDRSELIEGAYGTRYSRPGTTRKLDDPEHLPRYLEDANAEREAETAILNSEERKAGFIRLLAGDVTASTEKRATALAAVILCRPGEHNVEALAGRTWAAAYPDRSPWDKLAEKVRTEWVRVTWNSLLSAAS